MMMFPKKKMATVIVGSLKKPKAASPEEHLTDYVSNEEPAADDSMGLESAVESLFKAYEEGDVKAGVSAIRDFLEIYDYEVNAPSESEEG